MTCGLLALGLVFLWAPVLLLVCFAFSADCIPLVSAGVVSGPAGTTLPVLVFSALRLGLAPEINALGAVILALTALCVALAALPLRAQWLEGGGEGG